MSREEILTAAQKEGRLTFASAHEETAVPHLVAAFKKKYPFIREVSFRSVTGIPAAQRELFELAAGESNVDAFTPHSLFWSEYFKQDLFAAYNIRELAKRRQLEIPGEMIDDSDLVVWTSTNSSIIVYNRDLVPADKDTGGLEPFAVYAKARNPNAALLWMEFLTSSEAQQIVDRFDPGKAFFMFEGTVANKLMKGNEASICTSRCRAREEKLMEKIAVEAWGFPKVGASGAK
ncbi:MAG TPA: hypothetical protein VNL14_21930 [Candidatus Acidoferrales bacterium]|nr:hypothetical protein [Candidatus Acidoferrales bacterium]